MAALAFPLTSPVGGASAGVATAAQIPWGPFNANAQPPSGAIGPLVAPAPFSGNAIGPTNAGAAPTGGPIGPENAGGH